MKKPPNTHGGARAGAGRPAGGVNEATLRKRAIREYFLKRFEEDAAQMYEAQKAQACGTKFLVTRDPKNGKFTPVTEEQAKIFIETGQGHVLEIWDRPPATQAFVALSDRAIDRPTEHHQLSGEDGAPIPIQVYKWKT